MCYFIGLVIFMALSITHWLSNGAVESDVESSDTA